MAYFHVWFSTKQRKWLLQGDIVDTVKAVMTQVARQRRIQLCEMETMVDHMQLLLESEPGTALSRAMKYLKGRSAYEVFKAFPELKQDAQVESLWQDGFKSRIVPPEQLATVSRYIRTQDQRLEKLRTLRLKIAGAFNPGAAKLRGSNPGAAGVPGSNPGAAKLPGLLTRRRRAAWF